MNISAKRPKQAFGRIFGRDNIEALLVDEELADQVWEACHSAEINEICVSLV